MDRIDAMQAFVTVAELKSFSQAAARLQRSAPAVTRLISALEERLTIRLLQRTTRAVRLTDAGERYLHRARRILDDLEQADGAAQRERQEPTGRLVVAASNVFGRQEVAALFCEFLFQYPKVVGELTLSDQTLNLIDSRVDIAIRMGQLNDSSLVVRKAGRTRRVLVASPSYLAAKGTPTSLVQLAQHHLIQFTALESDCQWTFWKRGVAQRIAVTPSFVTNSADAAIGHSMLGGGLTLALSYQVAAAVEAKKLCVVLARYEPPALPIQVVYPSARLLSAAARAFVDLTLNSRNWNFCSV